MQYSYVLSLNRSQFDALALDCGLMRGQSVRNFHNLAESRSLFVRDYCSVVRVRDRLSVQIMSAVADGGIAKVRVGTGSVVPGIRGCHHW